MSNKYVEKICYLILIFFAGAFVGKIYETLFYFIVDGNLYNTGSLFGPWIPVYGSGAVCLYFLKKYKNNPFILFLLSMLITGILEYLTGFILDNIMNTKLWNYDGLFLNINGYICFRSIFTFGIGGLILHYIFIPFLDKLMMNVKFRYLEYFSFFLIILFIIDIILSILFKDIKTY